VIVTFASVKGGTGKTTCSLLFALYLLKNQSKPVVIVDTDAQGGSTSLLLGTGQRHDTTVLQLIEAAYEGYGTQPVMRKALQVTDHENLFVVPSSRSWGWAARGITELHHLGTALRTSGLYDKVIFVVDSAPDVQPFKMCIVAADHVFVPIMASPHNIEPVSNIWREISSLHVDEVYLVPVRWGDAKWQTDQLGAWQTLFNSAPELATIQLHIATPIADRSSIDRADWVRTGNLPEAAIQTMDELFEHVLGWSALERRKQRKALLDPLADTGE